MTTFTDGPAAAIQLNISRTPIYLRVVHDIATDQWDALDQLADTPKPTEEIHVYRIDGEPMRGFWDGTDGRGRAAETRRRRTAGRPVNRPHASRDQPGRLADPA